MSGGRIAGAPVSWGVIEVPDWGYQMPADRVLRDASSLGLAGKGRGDVPARTVSRLTGGGEL